MTQEFEAWWNQHKDKPIENWSAEALLWWFRSEIEDNANNGIRRKFRTAMHLWYARDAELAAKDAEIERLTKLLEATQRYFIEDGPTESEAKPIDRTVCTCDPKYMGFATDCPMHNESEAKP